MTQNQKLHAILRHLDYISNHRYKSILTAADISKYFFKEFEVEIPLGKAKRLCQLLIDNNVVAVVDTTDEVSIGFSNSTSKALQNSKYMD
ncbi:hypothetical protein [Ekhidna sp.]|jgi:hypothetical protein|uniref:hypothetical protein n=1 Tax=Ekhidna sp. TaxID=2608089 RepID=UPI0032EC49BB